VSAIFGVVLIGVASLSPSVKAAATDCPSNGQSLVGWSKEGYQGTGSPIWQTFDTVDGRCAAVQVPPNDEVHTNGSPGFLVSPTNYFGPQTGEFEITLQAYPEPAGDNDYIGFAMGYTDPIDKDAACANPDTGCNTDFVLFDWKKSQEYEGGQQTEQGFQGWSLMRVHGPKDLKNNDTSSHQPCFWTHEDVDGFCDVLATKFGPPTAEGGMGYEDNIPYTFHVTYGADNIKIVLLGTAGNPNQTIFDVDAPQAGPQFAPGAVAFYNYSQPNVFYSFNDLQGAPATTTTTTDPNSTSSSSSSTTSTTAVSTTSTTSGSTATTAGTTPTTARPGVGPATQSTLQRTGIDSRTTTIELFGGVLFLALGAMLSAARGKRPEGVHFR
jgi:hypothetical protein